MQKIGFGVQGAATGYTDGALYACIYMEMTSAVRRAEAQRSHEAKVQRCCGANVHESIIAVILYLTRESLFARARGAISTHRLPSHMPGKQNVRRVVFHRPVLVRAHP